MPIQLFDWIVRTHGMVEYVYITVGYTDRWLYTVEWPYVSTWLYCYMAIWLWHCIAVHGYYCNIAITWYGYVTEWLESYGCISDIDIMIVIVVVFDEKRKTSIFTR